MENFVFDAQIAEDPKFDEQLRALINEKEKEYKKLRMDGSKVKASPLTRLIEEGKLTVEFLKGEFPKIANKKSALPASKREVISYLVFNAAQRTVLMKRAEREKTALEKANAKQE